MKWDRRVDLNEAIRYLITRNFKRPDLLERACKPVSGFEEAFRELREERIRDEEKDCRKFGL
ncbi:MAG: hypothetical protein RMI79_07475 [Nitrososphaerota archaeon]|nr:hypothetical protein [Nitrososphaerota archaeon]